MTAPPTDPSGLPASDPFPPQGSSTEPGSALRPHGTRPGRPNRFVVAIVILAALAGTTYYLSRPAKQHPGAASNSTASTSAGQPDGVVSDDVVSDGGSATDAAPSAGPTPSAGTRSAPQGSVANCKASTLATAAAPVALNPQAGDSLKSASYKYTASTIPQVEIGGHLSGPLPSGGHLFTADWADPTSTDSTADHSPGNARYYPAAELQPGPDLCFHQARHRIGYAGFGGLRVRIYVLLVDANNAASFAKTGADQDGYTDGDLAAHGAVPIGYFVIQTK